MIFRKRKRDRGDAERGSDQGAVALADYPNTLDGVLEEIAELTRANRLEQEADRERRILRLRHRAGAMLASDPGREYDQPDPDDELLANGGPFPEVTPEQLTPRLARAAIIRHGCLCVRGMIDRDDASRMVEEIDRAYDAREAHGAGNPVPEGYYEEFVPDAPYELFTRKWVGFASGLWGADSPRVMASLLDAFDRVGLRRLATEYLGGHPLISVDKCTLRRVEPDSMGSWHQDGAFLGDVRALNVWLSLSRCGDVAPGLDIVPRRLDHIVRTGTEGSFFDWDVAPDVAKEAAGDVEIMRPVFEPGDVMLFDDLFLHSTATSPEMTETRYAVETWFFAPTGFPNDYVPLAL